MSRVVDERVAVALGGAAEAGSCYVPRGADEANLRRALCRRLAAGTVCSPARGLFADAEAWGRLDPASRSLWIARGLQALHPSWVF